MADIEKTPEALKPLRNLGKGQFVAVYTEKAQADFKGFMMGGAAVCFEAKHTDTGRMDQDRVTPAQAERLERCHVYGGHAFVLCSRTGSYALPKDYPSALRALADSEERRLALEAENAVQRQAIADFQPIKQYLDTILSSTGTMVTSQIAADYDMSAKRLNKILHEEGIQHYVNGQWILYKKYMGKGYTKSATIPITRSDGRPDTKLNTYWTQKGRVLIHEILTARGIQAIMDRKIA